MCRQMLDIFAHIGQHSDGRRIGVYQISSPKRVALAATT